MSYIEKACARTLNDSQYLLFDMSFTDYDENVFDEIYDIKASGYIPILAHPERYPYIRKNPNLIYKMVKMGCLIQVNQDSVIGDNGRDVQETVMLFLKHKLVHFVASDAHHRNRPVTLKESYDYLKGKIDDNYLEDLYENNARKVINDETIDKYEYTKIISKKYFGGLLVKRT